MEGGRLSSEGQIQYDVNTGNMTATNGVRITYKPGTPDEAELTANAATINQQAGTAVANGKVTITARWDNLEIRTAHL